MVLVSVFDLVVKDFVNIFKVIWFRLFRFELISIVVICGVFEICRKCRIYI